MFKSCKYLISKHRKLIFGSAILTSVIMSLCIHERYILKKKSLGNLWFQHEHIFNFYLKQNIVQITDIPENFCSENTWVIYAEKYPGRILIDIPEQFQTQTVWNIYSKKYPHNIFHIPEKNHTPEIWINCITSTPITPHWINHVPKKFFTQDFFNKIVEKTNSIANIPTEYISWDMCRKIKNNSYLINYIPLQHIDRYLSEQPPSFFTLESIQSYRMHKRSITMTGKTFNKFYGHISLIKLTNNNELQGDIQYKTGLNIYPKNFDPYKSYDYGIFISWRPDNLLINCLCKVGQCYIRPVSIPDDAIITLYHNKFKADRVILGERKSYKWDDLSNPSGLY